MNDTIFVTGTDTDAGKTVVACALLKYYATMGVNVAPFKPIAAGASYINSVLKNDDAQQLIKASQTNLPYESVNPFVFEEPIAPHIAAQKMGQSVSADQLTEHLKIVSSDSDRVVIEGAGGWQVPINNKQTFADWARSIECPTILVVGLRVGCINHALLTYLDIMNGPNKLLGWVANTVNNNVQNINEIVDYLSSKIDTPLLGTIPYLPSNLRNDASVLSYLDFSQLK